MPSEGIKRAIRRGGGEEAGVADEEAQDEGYGPGGCFFFSSRSRHTSLTCDWSSDVCSSDLSLARTPYLSSSVRDHRGRLRQLAPGHDRDANSSRDARCEPEPRGEAESGREPRCRRRSEERRVGRERSWWRGTASEEETADGG